MNANRTPSIIFFGTSSFAIPSLEALNAYDHQIIAIVTTPDRPAGRKKILTPPPIKKYIRDRGLNVPILQPVSLKIESIREELKALQPDLFIVAAYGKIIPKHILEIPRRGALNIHPSLLPRWRGPSPIQYTILHGDTKTGVTIIQMDELMDHGSIVSASSFQLPASSTPTYSKLHEKLSRAAATLLIETLPRWLDGKIKPIPQDESKATYSKLLTKEDGKIDWSHPADEIERMVRAFTPWPGAWTLWNGKRLRIEEAEFTKENSPSKKAGCVWQPAKDTLCVQAKTGSIRIKKLTLEGTPSMDTSQFLRGHPNIATAITFPPS